MSSYFTSHELWPRNEWMCFLPSRLFAPRLYYIFFVWLNAKIPPIHSEHGRIGDCHANSRLLPTDIGWVPGLIQTIPTPRHSARMYEHAHPRCKTAQVFNESAEWTISWVDFAPPQVVFYKTRRQHSQLSSTQCCLQTVSLSLSGSTCKTADQPTILVTICVV